MTRWASLASVPERPWLIWEPDRWLLPVPWKGVAVVIALCAVLPGLTAFLMQGRRAPGLSVAILAAGFLWATVSAWLIFWRRTQRRRFLAQKAHGDDWVCAACLHTEPPDLPMTIG